MAVAQQHGRELHRQRGLTLELRGFAPFELLYADIVLCIELAVADLVMQLGGQSTLGDVVSGKYTRIRIEHRQRDVLELHADVGIPVEGEGLDRAADGD